MRAEICSDVPYPVFFYSHRAESFVCLHPCTLAYGSAVVEMAEEQGMAGKFKSRNSPMSLCLCHAIYLLFILSRCFVFYPTCHDSDAA